MLFDSSLLIIRTQKKLLDKDMKAYGSKRTVGNCKTKLYIEGGTVRIIERIKSKKFGRVFRFSISLINN
jgi:hypothetical protein